MIIFLFTQNRIYKFLLPKIVEGSYAFDINDDSEYKLLNINASSGKWTIASNEYVNVFVNNIAITKEELKDNTYYIIKRGNESFLVYTTDTSNNKMFMYSYETLNLLISNNETANIKFMCPFIGNSSIKIVKKDSGAVLEQFGNACVYINDNRVSANLATINIGDEVNIYGLKIIVCNNLIYMNEPEGKLKVMAESAGLKRFFPAAQEEEKNIQIIDRNLYTEKDYYSKSPRLRRLIESKKIKLSPPPNDGKADELPLLLTIGPMMTMGLMSMSSGLQVFLKISSGDTTFAESWPQVLTAGAMLSSMLIWPLITKKYNKKMQIKKRKELELKYDQYLKEKEKEVILEADLQKSILIENLITVSECYNIIMKRSVGFWDKRIDQSDFLEVRLGIGTRKLDIQLEYPNQEFTIDEDILRKQADAMVEKHRNLENVPVSYSFYKNMITAIMGVDSRKCYDLLNNIILQLFAFYSYEDLKIVVFTNEKNEGNWDYIKYSLYNFTNEKNFRFFASTLDTRKALAEYMDRLVSYRLSLGKQDTPIKPYYLILTDSYEDIKRFDFAKDLFESDDNVGFSTIILSNKLNNLPSKCYNFISLSNGNTGTVLQNSYEKQEHLEFNSELVSNLDMMNIVSRLSNIPIEFEEGTGVLPESISFLEMMKVGKVEQLNVLNRWNSNDSTISLKSEIGVDEHGDLVYLDLHEKAHGPHGLIAGTTGSGKSEFIITYILSMCMNYSPEDVAFILIDYKGGGLALAFENKATGVCLPHLAGTITNLDKAEMDRTLVSIDSEVKRRQAMFNEARDNLGESTIDIYKYQKFYKEGKVKEPIPHLFIICDEFAELKAQQPDFMSNLISVARIGRSLGVHLILATQKPSGVVDDQIWSNTKFRVCLKVQNEQDSKEMLKRPEAAYLKQAGRFYLQVGTDEIFMLGQSGWCGAKYYPSDKIQKQVDRSIGVINDNGQFIKNIQASNGNTNIKAQGEQIQAVMNLIINLSNQTNKKAKRLWLENVPEIILCDNLEVKYKYTKNEYSPVTFIGEYDAPEKQKQGIVSYNYLEDGNAAIYGNDGSERELFLSTLIYDTTKNYSPEKINFYIMDFGSESLRKYLTLPHVGGMVFQGEDEKFNNLIKLIKSELSERKKLFVDYGGEYINYVKNSGKKIPTICVIINNYDSVRDEYPDSYEIFPEIVRDSERYGINFIFTGNAVNSIQSKITQSLPKTFTFKLKDQSDYGTVLGTRTKTYPKDIFGRGLVKDDGVHEFQVAHIKENDDELNNFIRDYVQMQKEKYQTKAKKIPALPNIVRFEDIEEDISNLSNVPIGISKNELEVYKYDFLVNTGNIITSNKITNTEIFVKSLLSVIKKIPNSLVITFDVTKTLKLDRKVYPYYYVEDMDTVTDNIASYVQKLIDSKSNINGIILIYNLNKYIAKISNKNKLDNLIKKIKAYENISMIIVDDFPKIKALGFEPWFNGTFSTNDGIWIGRGVTDQGLLRVSSITKEMTKNIKNNMGYVVNENLATLCQYIDFISKDDDDGK